MNQALWVIGSARTARLVKSSGSACWNWGSIRYFIRFCAPALILLAGIMLLGKGMPVVGSKITTGARPLGTGLRSEEKSPAFMAPVGNQPVVGLSLISWRPS